ncbi:MAG: tetratricopeptide repeat protein, partial [Deltaproteobacteria bacterium]|nr:tetratricopeptide repeat protein [Deltaproteobacteria bacterium]
DARRAYEQTVKLRADHPAAQSNLAELQWRAGNRDVAKRGWEAALAIDPKLYAAHVNLATAALAELRALAETDPARARLTAAARTHLQSALAVDDSLPAAFVALASLEADRAAVARFYVAEAMKRAQKQVSPVLASAAASARAERWAMAADSYRAAIALDPTSPMVGDAHLGLALVQLRLRRWDDARAALALVKVPSYDHHVATGVALRHLDKPTDALAAYDKAIALLPNRAEAYFDVGLLHTAAASQDKIDIPTARTLHGKAATAFRRASELATGPLKVEATLRADHSDKTLVQIDAFLKAPPPAPKKN